MPFIDRGKKKMGQWRFSPLKETKKKTKWEKNNQDQWNAFLYFIHFFLDRSDCRSSLKNFYFIFFLILAHLSWFARLCWITCFDQSGFKNSSEVQNSLKLGHQISRYPVSKRASDPSGAKRTKKASSAKHVNESAVRADEQMNKRMQWPKTNKQANVDAHHRVVISCPDSM